MKPIENTVATQVTGFQARHLFGQASPAPPDFTGWILLAGLIILAGIALRIVRSRPRGVRETSFTEDHRWVRRLNIENMIVGPGALLFAGLMSGGASIGHLLAAVFLFFGGLMGNRFFHPCRLCAKARTLTTNVLALLVGGLAVAATCQRICTGFRASDRAFALALAVVPAALSLIVTLITVVLLLRSSTAGAGSEAEDRLST
jgi:hypothetical protein